MISAEIERKSDVYRVDSPDKVRVSNESVGEPEKARVSPLDVGVESEIRVSDVNKSDLVLGEIDSDDEGSKKVRVEGELDWKNEAMVSVSRGDKGVDEKNDFALEYSMVDEGADTWRNEAFGAEASRALSYGFEPGDMVWGKVKSHPWWPGHIFSEAFASSSVRRTKRVGHLLVAFFGDSSYGWFDTAELIPFNPNYAEKSQQTSSRSFVKAVEEGVDESSRRAALGLTCKCRNPFNFRPTKVRGFFAVDVPGFEPGGVYSVMQIKKARENFQPANTLSFVQQLALNPHSYERQSIESLQNKAKILAYRKASYEEFDETYAQAFGMTPVRPAQDSTGALDQATKMPAKAPLSGPMVTAEVLGGRKGIRKPMKVKEKSKKDKYLFKRRDELSDGSHHVIQGHAEIDAPSALNDSVAAKAPGNYVLQKRTTDVTGKVQDMAKQGSGTVSRDAILTHGQEADSADRNLVASGSLEDETLHLDKETMLKLNGRMTSRGDLVITSTSLDGSIGKREVPVVDGSDPALLVDRPSAHSERLNSKVSSKSENVEQEIGGLAALVEDHKPPDQVWNGVGISGISESVDTPPLSNDSQLSGKVPAIGIENSARKKGTKKNSEDLNFERSFMVEKKKKQLKKEARLDASSGYSKKRLKADGEILRKIAGKSIGNSSAPSENSELDPLGKDKEACSTVLSDSAAQQPKIDLGNVKIEFPELVSELLALAVHPFYGIEKNSPELVRDVFLQFRSIVYQKSQSLAPSEGEISEELFSKPHAEVGGSAGIQTAEVGGSAGIHIAEDVRELVSKPRKPMIRPVDPTSAGRKRSLSGRQEEMSAKRLKKLTELKSMTAEKKAGNQKNLEVQREQKEPSGSASSVSIKPASIKKPEPPVRVSDPTMLVMMFPPQTALPSIAELKARFARFGPLDHSATRVFWKSSTCRVVFMQKVHAVAAYNHATRTKPFGQLVVNYQLRDFGTPSTEVAESLKRRFDDVSDAPVSKSEQKPMQVVQRPKQSNTQLKSILKKPSGDEAGPAVGVPRESPRVKFMLGGEGSSREEQVMSSVRNTDIGGVDSIGGPSASLGMDSNNKSIQKVIPPTLPPVILPFPPPRNMDLHENHGIGHFIKPPQAQYYSEVTEPQTDLSNSTNTYSNSYSTNNNKEISHQMLRLLVRCNDVVSDVTQALGYVPYHPL